jgi:hypothetical protein
LGFYGIIASLRDAKMVSYFSSYSVYRKKKRRNKMEINLKKRFALNHTLPVTKDRSIHRRITGFTSGNVAEISIQSAAYERSREYLAHIAEVELKRSLAQAEIYRLSLR